jgi:DNA-binding MarR family transcriptional regulator
MERLPDLADDHEPGGPGIVERPDGSRYLEPVRAHAVLGLVRAGDALVRALERSLEERHDLSLHQFEVLLFLAVFSSDRTMQMSDLRRHTPLSQSRVSRVVASLESAGLVRRRTDRFDSRAVNVSITERGLGVFKEAQNRHLEDLERHLFSVLSAGEISQLATITAKILEAQDEVR